ncbi:peptidoglycan recognition protein family protein [Streptomyces qinzhouensis]|uniref:N-acetylmuramoyl-L-alanine amidase n=1 Tax=Streptomyces qinzhouensis TaxID=2599401 RepID=A0A5B8JC04_9ACTN|nr:N-acetylmuramoyl-L-alanine amidase [Streptomyces qinzhouensis]QDY78967.1 N-acetylmuramoyl-L-alanine amidase [Streptomyces qinzhouensis]
MRGGNRSRRWWGGGAAVAAGVAGVLVVQSVAGGPSGGSGEDGAKSGSTRTEARASELKVAADRTSAELPRRDTKPFSLLGVTWTDPGARITGTIEVRTKSAKSGKWSGWQSLDGDHTGHGDGTGRGATDPMWVGPSKGVEVRVKAGGEVTALPAGIRLDMVDPGTGNVTAMEPAAFARPVADTETTDPDAPTAGTPSTDPAATAEPPVTSPSASTEPPPVTEPTGPQQSPPAATTGPAPTGSPAGKPRGAATATPTPGPPSTAPRPEIVTRAGWQADESISPEAPTYLPGDKVKAVTVHHTSLSNNYTCAEAPAVVRSVYAYHVLGAETKWKDIGYHFLVDKCGTIYEGRKGGMDRPVVGAHAYGFNSETSGIALLGNFMEVAPTQAALNSVARVAAWKLGQYGVDPKGTTVLTAGAAGGTIPALGGLKWNKGDKVTRNTIHGHGHVVATECPGTKMYPLIDTVRELAGGTVAGLAVTSVTGGGTVGTTAYVKNTATVNWKATTAASLVSKYEVLVNGKAVASTAGTAASAKVTLAAGSHQIAVRATHISRKTVTSAARTVVADATAPVFSVKPTVALRPGTVAATAVPVTLGWKATDARALKDVRLTKPLAKVYGPTVTSAPHTSKPAATAWSLTAYDQAGNAATAAVAATPVVLQETNAVKSGAWSTKSSSSYLGGKSYSSATKNASLTWTFTGRSAAWVVSRAATSGQAHVYVDGKLVKTVDLKSSTTKYRDAIWTQTWATSAKHTVKIVVVGTAKRPTVTTDGLVYVK